MKNDINKQRLMNAANYLNKHQTVLLRGAKLDRKQRRSFAMHMAWYFEDDFRNMLRTGVWQFCYFKKEGGIRQALGTLKYDLIPEEKRPKSTNDQRPKTNDQFGTFSYFDLDKNGWRSFCLENFIGFTVEVK